MPILRGLATISQGISLAGHGAGTSRGDWSLQLVESGDVQGDGWLDLDGLREIGVVWSPRTERHLLRPFDVLVTARAGSVQTALVPSQVSRTVAGVTLLVVRAQERGMGHWLWYFLTSAFGQAEIARRLTISATIKSLSASSLGEIEVPVPSARDLERVVRLVEASEAAYTSAIEAAMWRRDTVRDSVVQEIGYKGKRLSAGG